MMTVSVAPTVVGGLAWLAAFREIYQRMDGMKTTINNLLRIVSLTLGVTLMVAVANAQPAPASNTSNEKAKETKAATDSKTVKTAKPRKTETETTSVVTGEDAGNYTVTSTIEFGYRGLRVDGDNNKFKSDLNYKAGPRLFDTSFLARSKDGKGGLFDTLLVTSTGWGADPYGNMRVIMEKPSAYRFEGTYRRFKYY